mgnify:CR=1 FL=1
MALNLESLSEATSGAVGALVSTTILYPLDTCKSKYQAEVRAHHQQKYRFFTSFESLDFCSHVWVFRVPPVDMDIFFVMFGFSILALTVKIWSFSITNERPFSWIIILCWLPRVKAWSFSYSSMKDPSDESCCFVDYHVLING